MKETYQPAKLFYQISGKGTLVVLLHGYLKQVICGNHY
jgi:hypothetical protein